MIFALRCLGVLAALSALDAAKAEKSHGHSRKDAHMAESSGALTPDEMENIFMTHDILRSYGRMAAEGHEGS